MAAAPSGAEDPAGRPGLRGSWDGDDVVRFYAGSPFSNFARSPIWLPCPLDDDVLVEHPTVEHAFQAAKATSWPDFRRVWLAPTPAEAKRVGRWEITARPDWPSHRFHAMLAALRAKYRIPRFREALLATGDRPLAEDSPSDFEWGARDGRGGYTGRNYLGRALMRVRDELREHPPEPPADPSRERLPSDTRRSQRRTPSCTPASERGSSARCSSAARAAASHRSPQDATPAAASCSSRTSAPAPGVPASDGASHSPSTPPA